MKYRGFQVSAKHMIDGEWRASIYGWLDGKEVSWSVGERGNIFSRKEVYAAARTSINKYFENLAVASDPNQTRR